MQSLIYPFKPQSKVTKTMKALSLNFAFATLVIKMHFSLSRNVFVLELITTYE